MEINIALETAMPTPVIHRNRCTRCGHNNPTQDTFCEECGQIIDVSDSTLARRVFSLSASDKTITIATFHSEKGELLVPLQVGQRATLGRLVPYMLLVPDIDLTPLNGAELGVSRNHAVLDNTAKGIQITDLDSRNGTFVNGKRLPSLNSLLLSDGDQLRFGQLEIELHLKTAGGAHSPVVAVAAAAASTPAQGTATGTRGKETRLLSP